MSPVTLDQLETRHPEWRPWLAVLREVQREIATGRWNSAVPALPEAPQSAPLITRLTVRPDAGLIAHWWVKLRRTAAASAPPFGALQALPADPDAALRLFHAALHDDASGLAAIARESGVEPHALHAVSALLPVPFLHACRSRWANAVSRTRREGGCPTCGAWPALAEICGVERTRYLRCARCGCGWEALVLFCPYCETTGHDKLATLVPEERGADGRIEVCHSCRGYLKAFTRLTMAPPESVMIDDLASVALDLAAAERGYARPPNAGRASASDLARVALDA